MSDAYLPPADALTEPWWNATREGRLLLQRCEACGGLQHYPRYACVRCGSVELGWTESAGDGVVDSFTAVHRAPRAGVPVPYLVARVRLDDGPLLLTNLVEVPADEDAVAIGDRVELRWRDLPDGRALPVFAPSREPT